VPGDYVGVMWYSFGDMPASSSKTVKVVTACNRRPGLCDCHSHVLGDPKDCIARCGAVKSDPASIHNTFLEASGSGCLMAREFGHRKWSMSLCPSSMPFRC
jgi:hypothetical protein